MKRLYKLLFAFILLNSCDESAEIEEEKLPGITEQHLDLIGKWKQLDNDSIRWEVGVYEVKWKSFTHPCKSYGDTIKIGTIPYHVQFYSKDSVRLKQKSVSVVLVK